jgi:hypothetical protein
MVGEGLDNAFLTYGNEYTGDVDNVEIVHVQASNGHDCTACIAYHNAGGDPVWQRRVFGVYCSWS